MYFVYYIDRITIRLSFGQWVVARNEYTHSPSVRSRHVPMRTCSPFALWCNQGALASLVYLLSDPQSILSQFVLVCTVYLVVCISSNSYPVLVRGMSYHDLRGLLFLTIQCNALHAWVTHGSRMGEGRQLTSFVHPRPRGMRQPCALACFFRTKSACLHICFRSWTDANQ